MSRIGHGSGALLLVLGLSACAIHDTPRNEQTVVALLPPPATHPALPPLFDDIERRTFDFFWETGNPDNGLVPDRYPRPGAPASIAAVGFALTAYPIGAERGYITRAQARQRTLATVRFFRDAPQGPQAAGVAGYKGFFYHFLDLKTGARHAKTELSTIDTALLMGGMLYAQSYFDGADAEETEIREGVETIYARIEWPWFLVRSPAISMSWHPESGFSSYDYRGYGEGMILYVLAFGSPTHPVPPEAWGAWTGGYKRHWGRFHGYEHLGFEPLFGHQYSHTWIDFRGLQDEFMRSHGIDYFENTRRAAYSQRAYAIANPGGWVGYGENVWGLTACDGPGHVRALDANGRMRQFRDYFARGAGITDYAFDDGTIAPTAAVSSVAFAPEIAIPAAEEMHRRYGAHIYGRYGFLDSFNPSFTATGVKLSDGQVIPGFGWVDNDYIGIDQGEIVAMIANYRDESVWKVMRRNPHLRRGLERAGFTGGWLAQRVETGFLNRSVSIDGTPHRYQVYVPSTYRADVAWPVILFLHGSGESGTDGLLPTEIGLGTALRRHPDRYPAIVVFPQTPSETSGNEVTAKIALAALDKTVSEFRTDADRIYLTGLSMGGTGAWYLGSRYPERFAAVVPVCGRASEAGDYEALAKGLQRLPVWIYHGESDTVVPVEESRQSFAALKAARADVHYTEFPGGNHNAWDGAYQSEQLPEWLLKIRRRSQ